MGSIWLTNLPDIIHDAGVRVREWPGWPTRARSSGGYDDVYAVVAHHTASSATPDNDCSYMWEGSPDRPIGAMLLDRTGLVTVGAAGATNTQGKGGPWTLSQGTIPLDKGNAYAVAIEAANNGTGEAWPTAQVDAYIFTCAALCETLGLDPGRDVISHREWCEPSCPGRKVDPAGPSPWATSGPWNMDGFRRDVEMWQCGQLPEEDQVTDDDVERIATAVWRRTMTFRPTNKQMSAEDLLETTAHYAANADVQTRDDA